MGLFGSLFTGVSALSAQSQSTAIISNNIANVNTTGFKRSEASFNSLVTTETRSSRYSPGTVSVNQQGSIQQTASGTDASISGNGFFPIKRSTDFGQEFLYTRAGQFSEDATGLLRNASGFVLYAWPLDANGDLPANQGDLSSLVPADVAFLGGLTRPTSSAELAINLNSSEVDKTLSAAETSEVDFTRSITVYDSLGAAQQLTLNFTKTFGPGGTGAGTINNNTFNTNILDDLSGVNGDTFTIDVDGNPGPAATSRTFTFWDGTGAAPANAVQTIGDIIDNINDPVTGLAGMSAFLGNNGELVFQRDDFVNGGEDFVLSGTGSALGTLGFPAGPTTYDSNDLNNATYDNGSNADTPPYSSGDFPSMPNLPGDANYNKRGWWKMEIVHPNGNTLSNGLVNFNGDGSLNAVADSNGNKDIELSGIDWGNGSQLQSLNIDIERFSQFEGNYDVIFSDQNGAELGLRTGVEITREGKIVARFSNGAQADLYQIPLVTFANANGLNEVSGTAYSENSESGEENLREAGRGGAGFIEPSTLESSNVDLADEFAKLIGAQRAYGAGTRPISTVDQMTQDLLNLR